MKLDVIGKHACQNKTNIQLWGPQGREKPFNKQEEGGTSCLYAVSSLVLKRLATLAELAGSLKCPGMGMLQKILQAGVSMHLDGGGNVPSRR